MDGIAFKSYAWEVKKLTLIIPWGKIKKKPTVLKVENVDINLTMDWMDDAESFRTITNY